MPVPASATSAAPSFGAAPAIRSVAVFGPSETGPNPTVTSRNSPGARTNAPPPASIENSVASAPISETSATESSAVPSFRTVKVRAALAPRTVNP